MYLQNDNKFSLFNAFFYISAKCVVATCNRCHLWQRQLYLDSENCQTCAHTLIKNIYIDETAFLSTKTLILGQTLSISI